MKAVRNNQRKYKKIKNKNKSFIQKKTLLKSLVVLNKLIAQNYRIKLPKNNRALPKIKMGYKPKYL